MGAISDRIAFSLGSRCIANERRTFSLTLVFANPGLEPDRRNLPPFTHRPQAFRKAGRALASRRIFGAERGGGSMHDGRRRARELTQINNRGSSAMRLKVQSIASAVSL
jgi:hypothetical protein